MFCRIHCLEFPPWPTDIVCSGAYCQALKIGFVRRTIGDLPDKDKVLAEIGLLSPQR